MAQLKRGPGELALCRAGNGERAADLVLDRASGNRESGGKGDRERQRDTDKGEGKERRATVGMSHFALNY